MTQRITKTGDEADVVCKKTRRVQARFRKAGATDRVKKQMRRRERRDAKHLVDKAER
jgi:hypothetical protein